MRVFVSIEIPEKIKEKIKIVQEQLPEFIGKKIEKENLHLTLKFLGEISDEEAGKVRERLRRIRVPRFNLLSCNLGVFSPKMIRIVWMHLLGSELLQKTVDESLKDFFPSEERFMSHLTIGRVKHVRDRNEFLKSLEKISYEKFSFEVTSFKLMKSTLTHSGPKYDVLEEFHLG